MALCRFLLWNTPLYRPPHPFALPQTPTLSLSLSSHHHHHHHHTRPAIPNLRRRTHSISTTLRPTSSSLSPMDSPPQGYRRNVGICLINPSKQIFAASRLDIPDAWQMPQGGIDEGEDPRIAAIRELREETGATSVEVLAEVPYWLTYDFPPDVREKLNRQWGSDWKGQAQKWFLLKFLGNEDEINLLGDGKEKPEFGKWTWMAPKQVVELAVEFKRPVYEEVLKAFEPHLQ